MAIACLDVMFAGIEEERHNDERSRGLSHHSTRIDAGGLDFRVRYGTGYYPSAMAVRNSFFEKYELICAVGQRPT
jgi:hypothetical protein